MLTPVSDWLNFGTTTGAGRNFLLRAGEGDARRLNARNYRAIFRFLKFYYSLNRTSVGMQENTVVTGGNYHLFPLFCPSICETRKIPTQSHLCWRSFLVSDHYAANDEHNRRSYAPARRAAECNHRTAIHPSRLPHRIYGVERHNDGWQAGKFVNYRPLLVDQDSNCRNKNTSPASSPLYFGLLKLTKNVVLIFFHFQGSKTV